MQILGGEPWANSCHVSGYDGSAGLKPAEKLLLASPSDPLVGIPVLRSEKLQNESSPNFSNFCPGFCSEFFEDFLCFDLWGNGEQKKIHEKSLPFFNAKFPGKHGKNIHKIVLESRQSNSFFRGYKIPPAPKIPETFRGGGDFVCCKGKLGSQPTCDYWQGTSVVLQA